MHECSDCLLHKKKQKKSFVDSFYYELRPFYFGKGELIFSEKQSLKGIYCIREGTCLISKTSSNGRDQIIELLSKGTLLGIRSVLCEDQTNLKAQAVVAVRGCFLSKNHFLKLLNEQSNFSLLVTKELAEYVKRSDDKIVAMGQKNMHQRVAEIIIELPMHFETLSSGFIDVKLRREDLANLVGVATESLIRAFSYFQEKNWIQLKGKQLRIEAPNKLKQFSEGHILK